MVVKLTIPSVQVPDGLNAMIATTRTIETGHAAADGIVGSASNLARSIVDAHDTIAGETAQSAADVFVLPARDRLDDRSPVLGLPGCSQHSLAHSTESVHSLISGGRGVERRRPEATRKQDLSA